MTAYMQMQPFVAVRGILKLS